MEAVMKPSKPIQTIIAAIAAKHGLDLQAASSHLRLEQASYEPLVIEKVGCNRVSVAHYYVQNGDPIADPDIVFWIGPDCLWYPFEISQMPVFRNQPYTMTYVEFDDQGQPVRYYTRFQHDLATFCNTWAAKYQRSGLAGKWGEIMTIVLLEDLQAAFKALGTVVPKKAVVPPAGIRPDHFRRHITDSVWHGSRTRPSPPHSGDRRWRTVGLGRASLCHR
jgi:hypothetical protein